MENGNLYQVFVSFIEFQPNEDVGSEDTCIWCKKNTAKNISHIFSRRLIKTNQNNNYLKKSICSECNSMFSEKSEDWLFKFTPLATWTQQFISQQQLKNLKFVPNFVFQARINEWVVIDHDFGAKNILPFQLIYNAPHFLVAFFNGEGHHNFVGDSIQIHYEYARKSLDWILRGEFTTYVSNLLPIEFHPRILIYKGNLILVGRTNEDINILKSMFILKYSHTNKGANVGVTEFKNFIEDVLEYHIHYKWSLKRYVILSTKIAFELLALYEGSDYCRKDDFNGLRRPIFKDVDENDYRTLKYEEGKGYKTQKLVPSGWIIGNDISSKDLESMFRAPIFFKKENCHSVVIYQVGEFLLCTVRLFSVDLLQLVLGKVTEPIKFWYAANYDFKEDKLTHYRCEYITKEFSHYDYDATEIEKWLNEKATVFLDEHHLKKFFE